MTCGRLIQQDSSLVLCSTYSPVSSDKDGWDLPPPPPLRPLLLPPPSLSLNNLFKAFPELAFLWRFNSSVKELGLFPTAGKVCVCDLCWFRFPPRDLDDVSSLFVKSKSLSWIALVFSESKFSVWVCVAPLLKSLCVIPGIFLDLSSLTEPEWNRRQIH